MQEGIALIVVAFRRIALGKGVDRILETAGAVERCAAPGGIRERFRGPLEIALFEGATALLVRSEPEVDKAIVRRLHPFAAHERSGREQIDRPAYGPAASEPEEAEDGDRNRQPPAEIVPARQPFGRLRCKIRLDAPDDPADVGVVGCDRRHLGLGCGLQRLEAVDIELRPDMRAGGVGQEPAVRRLDRTAFCRADAEHHQRVAPLIPTEGREGGTLDAVGHEQDGARHRFVGERFFDLLEGLGCVLTLDGHDLRRQRGEVGFDQRGIVAERQHHVGGAGIGEQGGARAFPPVENVLDLQFGAFEPRRRNIGRVHRRVEVDGDCQRCGVLDEGRPFTLPGRASGCDRRNGDQCGGDVHRLEAPFPALVDQQVIEQMRCDHVLPLRADIAAPGDEVDQQRDGGERQQPQRPQKVKIGDHGAASRR
ncbi:hypothetical protein N185_13015 [Sinorhizobium sp. GW3]|nr:hypothetical protein N185_13015 [Sinorhizobium sp. GW3]